MNHQIGRDWCSWYTALSKRTQNVTVKNCNGGQKKGEEYVLNSITCGLFVREEVKIITFLGYKKECG